MAVVKVIHEDGRTARMSRKRFAAVQADGWRLAEPGRVVDADLAGIDDVLAEVGNDPVKAAAAIEHEAAGKNRITLITKLQAIASGETNQP